MKTIVSLFLLSVGLLLGGCAMAPSQMGMSLIGGTTEPITATSISNASKTGTACGYNIFGLITSGDFSIKTAKSNGNITNVATVDKSVTQVLGIYSNVCTIVTGN